MIVDEPSVIGPMYGVQFNIERLLNGRNFSGEILSYEWILQAIVLSGGCTVHHLQQVVVIV